jgi:uncharacterized protein YueI
MTVHPWSFMSTRLLERLKLNVDSQTVYNPLAKDLKVNLEVLSRVNHITDRAMVIPG